MYNCNYFYSGTQQQRIYTWVDIPDTFPVFVRIFLKRSYQFELELLSPPRSHSVSESNVPDAVQTGQSYIPALLLHNGSIFVHKISM